MGRIGDFELTGLCSGGLRGFVRREEGDLSKLNRK